MALSKNKRLIGLLILVLSFMCSNTNAQEVYSYDNAYRLIKNAKTSYFYDKLGNRITLTRTNPSSQNQQIDLFSTNTPQAPPSLPKGSSLDLTFDLKNESEEAQSNIFNQLYWSRENTVNEQALSLKTDYQNTISPNQTLQKQLSITLPDTLSDGSGFLIIKVDSKNLIEETNEDNNTIVIPITIDNSLIPERTIEVDFHASLQYVCPGSTVFFDDVSNGEPTEWLWEFEGGLPATSTEQNPRVVYAQAGTYHVKLTAKDGDLEGIKEQVGYIIVEGENDNSTTTIAVEHAQGLALCEQGTLTLKAPDGFTGYFWSNGETSQEIEVNEPGDYTLMVRKCNGDEIESEAVTVTQESFELSVANTTEATCHSGGSITLAVSGTEDFSVAWSNGSEGLSLENLESGYYEATVTSQSGCSKTISVSLTQSQLPAFEVQVSNTTCGEINGSVQLTLEEPDNYEIEWSNGETTASLDALESGSYWVKVTNIQTQCETTKSVFIESSDNPLPDFEVDFNHTTCGLDNGTAKLDFEGIENFEVKWNGETIGTEISDLTPGEKTVLLTHIETGCSVAKTFTIDSSEDTSPEFTVDLTATTCGLENGRAVFSFTGNNNEITFNEETFSNTLENLASGSHTVTLTNTVTNCSKDFTFTIGESDAIEEFDLGVDETVEQTIEKFELPTPNVSGSWSFGSGTQGQLEENPMDGKWYFLPEASGIGTYELIYTATALNCEKTDSFEITVSPVSDIQDEVYQKTGIRLFPNPSDTEIFIKKDHIGTEQLRSFELVNEVGASLSTKTYTAYTFEDTWKVSSYPSGLYFMIIKTNQGAYRLKVLIQH